MPPYIHLENYILYDCSFTNEHRIHMARAASDNLFFETLERHIIILAKRG